jgi:hypothetical protein
MSGDSLNFLIVFPFLCRRIDRFIALQDKVIAIREAKRRGFLKWERRGLLATADC